MTRKVFIVSYPGSGHLSVAQMFVNHGWAITKELDDADLVQFSGGSDVDPKLYGQFTHSTTFTDVERDEMETTIFNQAQELGIPCAGICRGGQFLHVMNGGEMWQNIDNHMHGHQVTMYGKLIPIHVSSDHHQQMQLNHETRNRAIILMFTNESKHKEKMSQIAGVAQYAISAHVTGSWNKDEDLEALFYPDTNCLCFQPHPEYEGYKECEAAYFHLLDNYTFGEEKEEVKVDSDETEFCPDCQKQLEFCDC